MYASLWRGKAVPSEEKCGLPFSGWPSVPKFFAKCDITTTAFATTESSTITTSSTTITMTLKLQLSRLLGNESRASWCKGNQRKWCWNEVPFFSKQSNLKTTSSAFRVFEDHVFIDNDFQLMIRDRHNFTPKCKEKRGSISHLQALKSVLFKDNNQSRYGLHHLWEVHTKF